MTTDPAPACELVEIVTTVAHESDALRLGRALVAERLAACATWGAVRSTYVWKGALVEEGEVQVIFKTTRARASRAEARVRALHPYETPGILRLEIEAANDEFVQWVRDAVAAPPHKPEDAA